MSSSNSLLNETCDQTMANYHALEKWSVQRKHLAKLRSDEDVARRVAEILIGDAVVYDARRVCNLLCIPMEGTPPPDSVPKRFIVYVPKYIRTLKDLRQKTKAPMNLWNWFDKQAYTADHGYWEVILPVLDPEFRFSGNVSMERQGEYDVFIREHYPDMSRTPALVAGILLAVHKLATGKNTLNPSQRIVCPEPLPEDGKGKIVSLRFSIDDELTLDRMPIVNPWNCCLSAARWLCD